MSPSELSHADTNIPTCTTTAITSTHLLPTTHQLNMITTPSSAGHVLSDNNILMQCMQKLAHAGQTYLPAAVDPRVILQENNGQMMSATSAKAGEGVLDDQHGGAGAATGCTPRPRWCPTPEQIQVLEALFNSGTTTPSRDMIVEIAGCLKQFGNIVEANVFYWFQNRKARAKRKLRMQAQLQQQAASTSPTHSNEYCSSSQNGKSSATSSRRVCAKTACKTSPGAADHHNQLPSLVHLPTAGHHCDQIYHPNLLAAPTCGGLIGPLRSTLQVINNASSCEIMSSSNAELYPSSALSNSSCPSQTHDKLHALNHVLNISSERPPPFIDPLECTDHRHNTTQHHIACDPYNNHMSCINTENPHLASVANSSRPGSASSSDAMVRSVCSPGTAQQRAGAINVPHIFQTPHEISTFLASASDEAHYMSMAAADSYHNLALTSGSDRTTRYNIDRSVGSKRSWMDALMQEFVSTGPTHINHTNTSTPNIIHTMYDMNHQGKAQANDMLNINHDHQIHPPIDLNLLLHMPQVDPNQDSLIKDMPPPSQLNFVIRPEENKSSSNSALCRDQQHLQTSSISQAFHLDQLVHGQESKRSRDVESMESFMGSSSSTISQQQQQNMRAYAATSSPRGIHHCDNLPLWEALAPYMSIGS
ncbi:hypothetical protein GOP47_0012567 [Adiantum capillus-veneris]|uniref:Homeobox domain-containing protein n=1 Tax=Adiantum capillus-veneris TaxID=13818 RepID=A0A9D4ZGY5_ADICA|nr:hypothetical protein GOP47_0012567 [Adiantum capillus-veneris]